ncbi:hypothetical protein PPACK8108_LOCUS1268 [Phakopsora pachyrhizi]|uniref:Uncharacterized protein n=1 Tax=Phakopsora pachyrhizi TaxID=170000 RepID=A0AAV0AI73_PHAPC|nr:hypothetical protein PPACK8108_LOCUS1268 [Phakopsora pachyrhizi]
MRCAAEQRNVHLQVLMVCCGLQIVNRSWVLVRCNPKVEIKLTLKALKEAVKERGLSEGQMYSSRLLGVLLFTLEEIEIWDGPQSGTGKVEGSGGSCAIDVVLARREAALFRLEKIGIRRNNRSRVSGGSSIGVYRSCLNGLCLYPSVSISP